MVKVQGGCHCGQVRYTLHLTLPHTPNPTPSAPPSGTQRIYRCNCTTCHKMGQFHIRPQSPTDDFLLLSPLDPFTLGDYITGDKVLHFFFCKQCGVRPFIFAGDGEVVDSEVDGKIVQAWRPKRGGGHPEYGNYLSVNGHTIDAEQEFDMRELTEKKVVLYCDCYSDEKDEAPFTYERPQINGCY
ncbi:hypothetical protein Golomagni_06481 [Golovinomyces magnicellulatus]|nr:hypothetical protein Golomagni_06481 [Golovinomyces magnicellulatus]